VLLGRWNIVLCFCFKIWQVTSPVPFILLLNNLLWRAIDTYTYYIVKPAFSETYIKHFFQLNHPLSDEALLDDPDRRRLPPLLRKAWYSMNQAFRRRLSGEGITPDQFTVLRWLAEKEGRQITQKNLTDLMSSDPNTIASLVKRMEESKLLVREVSKKDRRANNLKLTTFGKAVHARARQLAIELQSEVLGGLSGSESDRFLQLLEKVAAAAAQSAGR
jgi:DNA-binding MarR family transcriptional regulator